MNIDAEEFLHRLASLDITHVDRAVALLWFVGLNEPATSISVAEICQKFLAAGYPKQNASRLRHALKSDPRTSTKSNDHFSLNVTYREELCDEFMPYVKHKPIILTESVLPLSLFGNAKTYIRKLVTQINASYSASLFDCTAVLCRRLLETLIIEAYEANGNSHQLKDTDGNYPMFSGLLKILRRDNYLGLGRNAKQGLEDFKRLGDQSAHDRYFSAHPSDIDRIRDGLRLACEGLLHLANQVGP